MKQHITLFYLLVLYILPVHAQKPTPSDIIKWKIKKMIVRGNSDTTVFVYDSNGRDTAEWENGKLLIRKEITYKNITVGKTISKVMPILIKTFSSNGQLQLTKIFSYKSDGSYSTKETDAHFGMTNTGKYDKEDKILQYVIPDGSVYKYQYDTKGRLTKMYSVPAKGGIKFNAAYRYNSKDQMIEIKGFEEYQGHITQYEYDTNGLLQKEKIMDENGQEVLSEYHYSYEF